MSVGSAMLCTRGPADGANRVKGFMVAGKDSNGSFVMFFSLSENEQAKEAYAYYARSYPMTFFGPINEAFISDEAALALHDKANNHRLSSSEQTLVNIFDIHNETSDIH